MKCHRSFPVICSEIAIQKEIVRKCPTMFCNSRLCACRWGLSNGASSEYREVHIVSESCFCIISGAVFCWLLDRSLAVFDKPIPIPGISTAGVDLPSFRYVVKFAAIFTFFFLSVSCLLLLLARTKYQDTLSPVMVRIFFPSTHFRLNCLILYVACTQIWNKNSINLTPCSGICVSYETCNEMSRVLDAVRFLLLPEALPVIWESMI